MVRATGQTYLSNSRGAALAASAGRFLFPRYPFVLFGNETTLCLLEYLLGRTAKEQRSMMFARGVLDTLVVQG